MNGTITSTPPARRVAQLRLALGKHKISNSVADRLAAMPEMSVAHAERLAPDIATLSAILVRSGKEFPKGAAEGVIDGYVRAAADGGFKDTAAAMESAREAILDLMIASEPLNGSSGERHSDPYLPGGGGVRCVLEDALYGRLNKSAQLSQAAQQFAGATMSELAGQCILSAGGRIPMGGAARIIDAALGIRPVFGAVGYNVTSDYPNLLVNVLSKRLADFYESAVSPFKRLSLQREAPDFRDMHDVRLGGAVNLEKVLESGEFHYSSLNEADERWRVQTYGKIVALSRQLLINDDLSAFDTLPRIFGTSAAETEAKVFLELFEANGGLGPTMADGKPVFDASCGNIAAGGIPGVTTITDAVVRLRRQTGLEGEAINVQPYALLVPPELEGAALKAVAEISPASADAVNPFAGRLEVAVEPRLKSSTSWYVAARPGQPTSLCHAYLHGQTAPYMEYRMGFEVDGMEIKGRHDFGAAFVDHRGWVLNPGA